MRHALFPACGDLPGCVLGNLLPLLLVLFCPAGGRSAAPPARLTSPQQQQWEQRNQLLRKAQSQAKAGQLDEAISSLQTGLQLERRLLGGVSRRGLGWLHSLAALQEYREQFAGAIASRRELLLLMQQRYAADRWQVVDARLDLEDAQRLARLSANQRQRLRRAVAWTAQVARLREQGQSAQALPLAQKALAARRELLGEKHHLTAQSWLNLGAESRALVHFDQAWLCFRQAVAVSKVAFGEKHPTYALGLVHLAVLSRDMADHASALPLVLEALEVYRYSLGKKHPLYANTLNTLAMLYKDMGEPARALPLFVEARDLTREVLGEKHPHYAISLSNLALLYRALGEPTRSLPLLLEVHRLIREAVGEKHPHYAHSLNNLGSLYQALGEHARALPLFLEARELRRKVLGETHPDYANSLNNLATLYSAMGEHARALPLRLEAHRLVRKVWGEKHPDYATSLNNLAALYRDRGEPAEALPLLLEACRLTREVLGQQHHYHAESLNNLVLIYLALGKPQEALARARAALAAREEYLDEGFDHLGPHQRTQFLQDALSSLGVFLTVQEASGTPGSECYAAVLSWKGRVAARGSLDRLARAHPPLHEPLRQLQSVRGRLVQLGLRTPPAHQQATWLKQLRELTQEKEVLEGELSRRSAAFRQLGQRQHLTPAQLSREVPADAALVDLLEYAHLIPPKGGKGTWHREQRLLAFVVRRGKEPVLVRLGPAGPIDAAVRAWRQSVTGEQPRGTEKDGPPLRADAGRAGRLLRERVWQPLARHLGGAKVVLVAPDGALCQLPLGALPGSKPGSYLIEEVAIAQLASAKQLLDLLHPAQQPKAVPRGLLAVGGVDYGKGKAYTPLPGTAPEAQRCRMLFRAAFPAEPATLLSGAGASVAQVQRVLTGQRPRYLHLATHGFFEPADRVERLLKGLALREDGLALWRDQEATLGSLPLLRCGLALAGANAARGDETPGILTGEDVEGLDLRGCELAVLSACQTALGDIARSQGVLGLQRSFHTTGARTTVCSLWSVSDAATNVLMEEFYKRLWGKPSTPPPSPLPEAGRGSRKPDAPARESKLDALRQAQLFVLNNPEAVLVRARNLRIDLAKRGVAEAELEARGFGKKSLALPAAGKGHAARAPAAWWAAFVLSGDWR
jgi:CHAT domain-containing protein/tetratricopeptide (TPR) repeat protein